MNVLRRHLRFALILAIVILGASLARYKQTERRAASEQWATVAKLSDDIWAHKILSDAVWVEPSKGTYHYPNCDRYEKNPGAMMTEEAARANGFDLDGDD